MSNEYYYNSESDPVALDLSNFAESSTSGPGTTPLFLSAATGIRHSPSVISPTLGGSTTIEFTLATAADVILRIYKENTTSPEVRVIPMPGLGAGLHTISWDGKDDDDNFVPDEAYVYALSTSVAGFTDVFNPPRPPEGSKVIHLELASQINATYNLYRNEPLKIVFDVKHAPGRVRVNRLIPGNPPEVTLLNFAPFPQLFNRLFVYDGFDSNGVFFGSDPRRYFFHPDPIQRNAVIVEKTSPRISGPGYVPGGPAQPPAIEVKGDPYLIRLSYDQISRIAFCIDQPADLTVKILKPGKGDPSVPADVVASLPPTPYPALNCENGGSPYVAEWNGTEAGPDPHVLRPVADGAYTFTIEARNAVPTGQTNLRSIYRGIVQTRQ
jgi:hypothetical protein